ncbi:TerB family tellurite resistance protein [Emcibacter sp.]|uniref:tellurite resistance TerB family protein n=1 Tax=Emcibacter sp. TaxID=1979954 RepID=UPI002AA80FE7|nr:TerB family tellurite resistance protein [Emcibacter sp.]
MSLFAKLGNILSGGAGEGTSDRQEEKLAAAALMVEVALQDGEFSGSERTHILALLEKRLGLEKAEASDMLKEAEKQVDDSHQILSFTRRIKDHFDEKGRENILELLWEVVYADGEESAYESNLMRRISGLLYVPDKASGRIRRQVRERRQARKTP